MPFGTRGKWVRPVSAKKRRVREESDASSVVDGAGGPE